MKKSNVLRYAALAMLSGVAGSGTALAQPAKVLDPANIDNSVAPGDNFFYYANGNWLKKNQIPASETRWGSFNELQDNNYKALRALLEEAAAAAAAKGTPKQMVGDFYRSGMDSNQIDKLGITPLKEDLARIDAIRTPEDLLKEIAYQHTRGNSFLYSFYVGPDDKNVTEQLPQFFQSGLGMPDRDYYLKDDARSTRIRDAYKKYQVQLLALSGLSQEQAQKAAANTFAIEQKLADASMSRVEMRDPYKTYNKFTVAEISAKAPGMNWSQLLQGLKIGNQKAILVGQPEFFNTVGGMIQQIPVENWKEYLRFHLVNDAAPYLSRQFGDTRFDFYGKTLRGQQEQTPRWKRNLNIVDGSIGDLLGKMYVDKNFRPEAKERMLTLVNNLQDAYAARIKKLDWMSPETKERALQKLGTFMKKIGYSDRLKTYQGLSISPDQFYKNAEAAAAWEYTYMISKLGKPVDRTEWGMTPPTVNAYYNPAFNEIVFPAGILQYPFFSDKADDAVNYGGIGSVIGHEMTHGFDDQGRQYDAEGNLKDWWTEGDAKQFTSKADVVINQFNNYTVLDTIHVNGELTLGENLADLGGLAIAYDAFQKTAQAKKGEKIDGFTPDQRFFLSWAQVWRANIRPEEAASRIVTDPHSPGEYRTNGPLSNIKEWYQAFNVKPGAKMYRPENERAKVW
ncbi:MAG: M13 family peptidase [Sphingobacteriales bacterium]|nr:MAG: M13 family peptidase [Sphingobacteriales bacterium]